MLKGQSGAPQEVTMSGRIAIALKALGVTLLFLFIWDYISVQRFGLSLRYRVHAGPGGGGAMVSVGWPDSETFFIGDQGYAWEIRPISISECQAVIDFRVKHFDHFAPAADVRAQLKQSEFRRLILRPEQLLTIEAPDGATVSLSGSIY